MKKVTLSLLLIGTFIFSSCRDKEIPNEVKENIKSNVKESSIDQKAASILCG